MNMPCRIPAVLVGSLVGFALLAHSGVVHAGKAGKSQDTVSKIVEINRQALAQLKAGKFEAARDALWGALTVLNDAKMSDHDISARTHVHLGAVYMTGFNDRTKAIKQFVMALKINPNINLTPQVRTAALDEAFDAARNRATAAVENNSGTGGGSSAGTGPGGSPGVPKVADEEEPPPPAKVSQHLFCPLPNEVPPKQDITLRCVTKRKPRHSTGTLFYRESGSEAFTSIGMTRSPRGWLTATVPASVVTGTAFQFYVTAAVPGVKEPVSMGGSDAPILMPIVASAAPMNNATLALLLRSGGASAGTAAEEEDKAPLEDINRQRKIDEDLRKYHRRYVGSLFVSVGGGMGITYHGRTTADGHFYDQNGTAIASLPVGAGTNPASLGQLVVEVGYVVSEKWAFSVQGRAQYVPFDSSGLGVGTTPPPTLAWAVFGRGQYSFLTVANFQLFASGVIGGGPRAFMAYLPKTCDRGYNPSCRAGTDHSNIVSAGPGAGGVGIGFLYHLTRWMGFWVEGRGLSSVAPIMLLAEANAGLSFAIGRAPLPPKEEGSWERPPEEDKPLIESPPAD